MIGYGTGESSSGNARPQSSPFAEPLWTDTGLKSGISARELISILKTKMQVGNDSSNLPQKIFACVEKSHPEIGTGKRARRQAESRDLVCRPVIFSENWIRHCSLYTEPDLNKHVEPTAKGPNRHRALSHHRQTLTSSLDSVLCLLGI